MTLTTLDAKTALITIDLQKGLLNHPTVHPILDIIDQSAQLAAAFRKHNLPVVLVNVTGGAPGRIELKQARPDRPADWADLVDQLDAQPSDYRVTKNTWGAFHNTSLHTYLQEQGVTQIVLVGVSTSVGVETTARSAYEHGYNVTLATDAMTDTNADAHQNSIERIFPKLGETGTTAEIIELLEATR